MPVERLLGHIGVDSGAVVIGDPCYLIQGGAPHSPEWQEVVAEIFDKENPRRIAGTTAVQVEGTIMTTTVTGDDLYPVYGLVDEDTGKIVRLTIDLTPAP